jgi:hypothetical protein
MRIAFLVRPGTRGQTGAAQVAQYTADWLNANGHTAAVGTGADEYDLAIMESCVGGAGHGRRIYRLHCEVPILAHAGDEIARLTELLRHGVELAANSTRMLDALRVIFPQYPTRLHYLPNLYPVPAIAPAPRPVDGDELHVGALGAMRPMKNQLHAAIGALHSARALGKTLHFHVNAPAFGDQRAAPILANLRALFDANAPHCLYVHPWAPRDEFLSLLKLMHVVMQPSLSETFCCVAADAISLGIPVLGSPEIPFTDLPSLQAVVARHEQVWREFLA